MSKISTYEVAPVPKLSDKLIGTSVGGEIEDITYNFTLLELLELFLPIIPANNLQGVLDYGNTATQDINLFGTITTTNLDVTDTANLFITYLNEETHLVGSLFDSADSVGTAGQVLTSTGDGVEWFTLPPIFTPNLEQVLTEGNTSSIDILLDANLEALDVSADTATVGVNLTLGGTVTDNNAAVGSAGQVLSSTVTGVAWVSLPVYSATSPLLFNSATGVFSIQVANSTQGGYLTANDWVTFDGKQNAGAYITALTGEATATGPGSVPITLNNASVTAKVLTGLNVTGGSISASDSILTAFGKVQSQINGLMGGVQYQGVWDAATNTPTLTSSVGTQGHYYIVNVAGSTDLNGITDWKVGDWAIFSGGTWQKVDNTESVTSVNGQTGAVSLTTDNIPEGATNLYYLDSRARAALSFAAGSGAYNSLTGVITIPTDNSQILNGAGYITLNSISATSPLAYNNLTGVFSIQQADATHNGYLSSTDWSTFNNKQNYLGGTGLVKSTAGTITYITDNSGNWNTAYNRSIVSAAVTGTTTKTLTLNEQDGNTITASWTDLDTGLTSVGVSMPSAFSVANSPLTSNGTIAVTGAGTTLEYIDGTGALRTFPGLTGYVPYTGATQNVDLGEFGISAGYFQADLTPTGALQVGRMQWNSTDGTMDLRLLGNNVTLQIGQENVTRVVNKSGIDLLEANYQVVRIRKVAEGGAQGQRLAVVLAQGNNENNSTEVIGLVTETINVNQEGFVTSFGEVKEIDTTGSLQGETWVDGDILYLSSTVAGQLTNVRPVAPNHSVIVGYVVYAHANNGKIYMAIDTGYELGELHNVYAPSPAANASIWWNTSTLRYENNTIAGILGYTPANPALYVPYTGATGAVNLGSNAFTTLSSITGGGLKTTNGVQIKYGDVGFGSDPDYLTIESYKASTVTSLRLADGDTLKSAILIFNNSVDYNYTFPNSSGTLALISDLGNYVTLGTAQTITANKTFSEFGLFDKGVLIKQGNYPASSGYNGIGALSGAFYFGMGQTAVHTLNFNTSNSYNYTYPNASGTIALVGGAGVGTVTSVAALTLGTGGTDLSSTVANPTTTPVITLNVPTASGTNRGALSAADWTTFNNKQAAGNYITSLTGEATATGPGAAAVTLNNASVTAKVLTGINITGGTVQATDTMLTAFGKLQNQINGLIGSTIYQGTWNASTNTPALASGVGVRGYYYIVSVAGNTNLDGITDWFIGDWAIFDGTAWQQVDNTDAVVSVNGQTGAVSLTTDNIPEGATNQYFTQSRARASLSFAAGSGAYNSTSGLITIPTNTSQLTNGASFITLASLSGTAPIVYSNTTGAISITQAGTASNGYLSSTDWNTFNNKQATISLTTNGSSGNATLIGATLNIPNYGSALAGYVPYTGATTNLNLGLNNLLLGSGNSGAYISMVGNKGTNYLQIENAGQSARYQMDSFAYTSKQFGGTKTINFDTSAVTGNNYVISFPDVTGTVALISDLSGYVTLATAQSISGAKTFTSVITSTVNAGDSLNLNKPTGPQITLNKTNATAQSWGIAADSNFRIINITLGNNALSFDFTTNSALFNSSVTSTSFIKTGGTSSQFLKADGSVDSSTYLTTSSAASTYLALAGGVMTGQIVLAAGTTSTDYTKGLRFPNDPYGGSGDTSGLRLYADTSTGAEAQVLELYVANDAPGVSVDKINFAAPNNDLVTINGNKIWNAGNLTPQSAITLTTTGTSGAATLVGATLNIPQYQSVLTNPITGIGSPNRIPKFITSTTIGDSVIFDNATSMSVGSASSTRLAITDNAQIQSYYAAETLPRYIINRDLFGGGLSGIGFTDREATLATWGVAVGLSAARELGFFVSNGTSLVKQANISSTGAATFNGTGSFGNGTLNGAYFIIRGVNGVPATTGTTTTAVLRLSSGTGLYNVLDFGTNESLDYSWIQSTRANSLGTYDYLAIQPNGGNLLVGTLVNSTYKLDVNGTGRFSGDLNVISAGSTAVLIDGTSPTITLRRSNNGNASSAINFKGSTVIKWQIGTNQAIGLGFEVNEGDATANRFYMAPGGASTFTSSVTAASFSVGEVSITSNQIYRNSANEFYVNYSGTGHTLLGNGTGNVGINAGTSPAYRLTVGGVADIQAVRVPQLTLLRLSTTTLSSDVNDEISIDIGRGGLSKYSGRISGYISNFSTYDGGLKFYTSSSGTLNTTPVLTLISTGAATFSSNVNVNTYLSLGTGSGKFLAVGGAVTAGSSADMLMYNTGGDIIFWATGAAGMTLKATSGNLGIGNTSPLTKLHVNDVVSGAILPYINATSLSYNSNGISVAGTNSDNTNIGNGITFYNNAAAVGTYGPVVAWSSQTVGGAYNSTYAFITGVYNGVGGDSNWAAGSIIFGTANAYGAQERMRLNRLGFLGVGSTDPTNPLHVVDGSYNRYTIRVQSAAANIANAYGGIGFSGESSNTKGAILFQSIASNSYSRGNMLFCLNNAQDQSNAIPSDAVLTLYTSGRNAVFVSSVTATAFFESSDSRLKQLIKDDYKAIGIESIKSKLYIKDGKEEVGYFAQDVQSILPTAVSVNDAGFLSLSYTQVHTAKIAIIEDEVTILKRRVAELESKLQA